MNGTSLSNFNIYYHLSVCPPGKHFWGGLSITRERKSGKPGANHSDLLRFAAQLSWPKKIVSRLIVSTGDSSKHSQPTSPSSIGYLRGDYWAISLRPLAGVGRSMYICLYIYIMGCMPRLTEQPFPIFCQDAFHHGLPSQCSWFSRNL
jgi:hypothetical protein